MNFLRGLGTALITPFEGGAVDHIVLRSLVERQISAGVDYIVALGTTGEAVTLDTKETKEVVDTIIAATAKRVPIVLGIFGGNNTALIVQRMSDWDLTGVDALLSASPHYNKPSQAGLVDHYLALDEASPLPIIMYNVPGRTASNMLAETTLKIARSANKIMGIKEASADLVQGAKILKHRPEGFYVVSGDDPTALPLMALGAEGVISVIANAYPEEFRQMTHSVLAGDLGSAQSVHLQLMDLHRHLYIEGNPTGIKACCAQLGLCSDEVRMPLKALSAACRSDLSVEMKLISEIK